MSIQQSRITYGEFPVIIPDLKQYPQARRKASSYSCPLGPATGVGWVLLTREQLDDIDPGNTFATLKFEVKSDEDGDHEVELLKLYIHSAVRMNPGGNNSDPKAAYLCKLVDTRFFLNRWSSTQRQFNVLAPASGKKYIQESSGDDDTPHGWEKIIKDLWDDCKLLGNYPGLPFTTNAPPPENLHFLGVNAWHALHSVLEKIGCTSNYNPLTGEFGIVQLREGQISEGESHPAEIDDRLIFEAVPFSGGACVSPAVIRVVFQIHYEDYGQERDTSDKDNFVTTSSAYYHDVTNTDFAIEGTRLTLWDDMAAIKGHAVNQITNAQELAAKAQQRAQAWWQQNTADRFSRSHGIGQGPLGIVPGAVIKQVLWRDYGPDDGGMLTEVALYPGLFREPLDEKQEIGDGFAPGRGGGGEKYELGMETPDYARHKVPNWPRLSNFVLFTGGSTPGLASSQGGACCPSEGDMMEAYEGTYIFQGAVVRFESTTNRLEIIEPCWIYGLAERKCLSGPIVRYGEVAHGRLSGLYTGQTGDSKGLKLPIYVARVADYLSVEVACACGTDVAYAQRIFRKCKVDNITFDEGVGIQMYKPNNNVDGVCVTIASPCKYSILNQWSIGQRPVWTQDPQIFGNLTIGGVLKFQAGRDNVSGSVAVRNGEEIMLGAGTARCDAPIEVVALRDNCVTWGYGQPGLSGFISIYHCCGDNYECANLYFTNGRVSDWDGNPECGILEPTPSSACGPAPCPKPDAPACNPCNKQYIFEPIPSPGDENIDPVTSGDDSDSFPSPGPFPPEEETESNIPTGVQDNPPVGEGQPFIVGVNRDLFPPPCTETFECGVDTDLFPCQQLIRVMERGFEGWRPLHENQTSLLAYYSTILGEVDYESFREVVSRCVAAETADLLIIQGLGEIRPDPCSGLEFTNVTPSLNTSYVVALGLARNAFLNYRPFTQQSFDELLALFSPGGQAPLEPLEFSQLRTIAACYFDDDRRLGLSE